MYITIFELCKIRPKNANCIQYEWHLNLICVTNDINFFKAAHAISERIDSFPTIIYLILSSRFLYSAPLFQLKPIVAPQLHIRGDDSHSRLKQLEISLPIL